MKCVILISEILLLKNRLTYFSGSLRASKQKWYDIGALYIVILIQLRYKVVCLVLVVCCGWDNMIRLVREILKIKIKNKKKTDFKLFYLYMKSVVFV